MDRRNVILQTNGIELKRDTVDRRKVILQTTEIEVRKDTTNNYSSWSDVNADTNIEDDRISLHASDNDFI